MTTAAVLDAPAADTQAGSVIALVDLSSIAHPIWHMSSGQPDPDYTATQIVARVRQLTADYPKAAICCDKGKSFRHDLAPSYKANRPQQDAALHHQIRVAREQLEGDGYPVWAIAGFEADDLIATAATVALGLADVTVRIFSADKDLLQLVGPRVSVVSVTSNQEYTEAEVVLKFGVKPSQMRDYLALVGDASDNVKGAQGIGPKRAAELLASYGSLDEVYKHLDLHGTQFKPAMATALREFQPRMADTQALITLRTDAPIPFAELDNERSPKGVTPMEESMPDVIDLPQPTAERVNGQASAVSRDDAAKGEVIDLPGNAPPHADVASASRLNTQMVVADSPAPPPMEWGKQLEPRSLGEAAKLAAHMHTARMFNGYGSPQAVLSTILAGRELGMNAIASLRGFHVIEGRHALSADAMRALVLRSGMAEYFRVVERTEKASTFATKRKGDPEDVRLTYTIEEGYAAFKPDVPEADRQKKWAASAWGKHPADMLAARASSKLARLVYPDILFGLYAPEELRD